ncbi:MAG: hypothetical protein VYD19_00620 [Myxococcota bacterium]|nr:hypothetical protein [Myxococcota bacterium]
MAMTSPFGMLDLSRSVYATPMMEGAGTGDEGTAEGSRERGFEDRIRRDQLQALGLRAHPKPSGVTVHSIHILRLEVFDEAETPWLTPLNALHALTRASRVHQELRLKPGERYSQRLTLESERNLRRSGLFAAVQVFPAAPLDSSELILLVITRDLWSLRLESAFNFTGSLLNGAQMSLVERNLFGQGQQLRLSGALSPFTESVGLSFVDPRLLGRYALALGGGLRIGRQSGELEGGSASISLSRPLYNLDQRWSYAFSFSGSNVLSRWTQGGAQLVWDDPETAAIESIPIQWWGRAIGASAGLAWQRPGRWTVQSAGGLNLSWATLRPAAQLSARQAGQWETSILPLARRELGPYLQLSLFERRFETRRDVSTFDLSEDLRLGPSASFSFGLPVSLDDGALARQGGLQLRSVWGPEAGKAEDGFLSLSAGGGARHSALGWSDMRLSASLLVVSPRASLGRLVLRSDWVSRWADSSRSLLSLGGSEGLRGYPTQAFYQQGGERFRGNLEYRGRPLRWLSVVLGPVLFLDVGGLHQRGEPLPIYSAAGAGLRLLFPQFNRSVFRLDGAAPLGGRGWQVLLSGGSQQAFPVMSWETR